VVYAGASCSDGALGVKPLAKRSGVTPRASPRSPQDRGLEPVPADAGGDDRSRGLGNAPGARFPSLKVLRGAVPPRTSKRLPAQRLSWKLTAYSLTYFMPSIAEHGTSRCAFRVRQWAYVLVDTLRRVGLCHPQAKSRRELPAGLRLPLCLPKKGKTRRLIRSGLVIIPSLPLIAFCWLKPSHRRPRDGI
jgi:hypothetical protein